MVEKYYGIKNNKVIQIYPHKIEKKIGRHKYYILWKTTKENTPGKTFHGKLYKSKKEALKNIKKSRNTHKRNTRKRNTRKRNTRKRKTKYKNMIKKNKKKKIKGGGGDGIKSKPIPKPTPPVPNPIPIPPHPPPKPIPNRSLKLISEFENIKGNTLYFLQAGNDLLYIFTSEKDNDMMNKEIWESFISAMNEFPEDSKDCEKKIAEDILSFFEKDEYKFNFPIICYRILPTDYPNYLCCSNEWTPGHTELFEAFFDYINSIYNIYEIDEWPKYLPHPPIKKSKKISLFEECSEDYIKQNKKKMECNQKCCGWPHSGYVCGEVDGLLGSEGACVQEKENKQNSTY